MSDRKIETIAGGEHIRLRWSMYLDSDPEIALRLALRELWINSCDELTFRKRKGAIKITLDAKKRELSVIDNGEGIPIDSLENAYLTVNTGSNFFKRENNLAGSMGIGIKAVSHTSEKVLVKSINNGLISNMTIKYGEKEGELSGQINSSTANKEKSGLSTLFIPSKKIYGESWIDEEALLLELDEAAKFYPLIAFEVVGDFGKKIISYPKGLQLKETEVYYESENLIISLSLKGGQIKPFGNRLFLKDGGAFFTHFKTQFTKAINETIDFKISGTELQSSLSGYVSIFVENPVFSNQQKSAIGNKEVNSEITMAIKNIVSQLQNSQSWNKFIKNLEIEVKAEEAAEKARTKIKNSRDNISKGAKKKIICADKLKDCINHGEEAWLAITEGNSAQGSLNLGRDIDKVATFPIRGKLINCLKNNPEKFLANEEIQQICQILGCDIMERYNSKKLKYGKVLICVDSDEDGKNIANLLMTFFYVCLPKFVQEGRLYWMMAPLYYTKEGQYIFTEEDWAKIKNKKGFTRAKGLGELDKKAVEIALFGKEKNWVQLIPKKWQEFSVLIESLMGTEVLERKEFLFNNIDFDKVKFL